MAFGGGWDDEEVISDINVTPLVDVMLVLLIVFMITVPVLTHTVPLNLPQANNALSTVQLQTIVISVTVEGAIYWNETLIDADQLAQRLQDTSAQTPQPPVQLRGDRKVEYEKMIQVMAAAQSAGLHQLEFVTEPMAAQKPLTSQ